MPGLITPRDVKDLSKEEPVEIVSSIQFELYGAPGGWDTDWPVN